MLNRLVRAEGFEPTSLAALEPKSSASASSATPAKGSQEEPRPPPGGAAYIMLLHPRTMKMEGAAQRVGGVLRAGHAPLQSADPPRPDRRYRRYSGPVRRPGARARRWFSHDPGA